MSTCIGNGKGMAFFHQVVCIARTWWAYFNRNIIHCWSGTDHNRLMPSIQATAHERVTLNAVVLICKDLADRLGQEYEVLTVYEISAVQSGGYALTGNTCKEYAYLKHGWGIHGLDPRQMNKHWRESVPKSNDSTQKHITNNVMNARSPTSQPHEWRIGISR